MKSKGTSDNVVTISELRELKLYKKMFTAFVCASAMHEDVVIAHGGLSEKYRLNLYFDILSKYIASLPTPSTAIIKEVNAELEKDLPGILDNMKKDFDRLFKKPRR